MAEACGVCGSDLKDRNHFRLLTVDRKVIIKCIMKEQGLKI